MKNKYLESFFFAMFSSRAGKKYELYSLNWVDEETHTIGAMDSRFVIDIDTDVSYDCYGGDEYSTVIKLVDEENVEYGVEIFMDSM